MQRNWNCLELALYSEKEPYLERHPSKSGVPRTSEWLIIGPLEVAGNDYLSSCDQWTNNIVTLPKHSRFSKNRIMLYLLDLCRDYFNLYFM